MTQSAQLALSFVAGAALASLVAAQLGRQDGPRAGSEATRAPARPPAQPSPAPPGPPPAAGDHALSQAPAAPENVRGAAAPDGGPVASSGAERERLQREQIGTLQARVRELERRAASAELKGDPDDPPQRKKFHDFTDAELQAMAQNCEVRFDLPRLTREPFHLAPDLGARLHLSESEQERVSAAVDQQGREAISRLRALCLEATNDAAGADALDPQSLMREILEKSPAAAVQAARVEIARERAGLPPAPTGTIAERYLRYLTSVGDSLQRALEPSLGAQQAGAVRDALAESRSTMSGCPH